MKPQGAQVIQQAAFDTSDNEGGLLPQIVDTLHVVVPLEQPQSN